MNNTDEMDHRQNADGKAHKAIEGVRKAAQEQAGEVRARAESAKEQTVDRIRRVGSVLRSAGEGVQQQDEFVADYARKASQRVDDIAAYLSSADARQVVRDTEQLARREPALFFGGAFLIGLAAGRFLKSSRRDDGREAGWSSDADGDTAMASTRSGEEP